MISSLIKTALSQEGIAENTINDVKYNTWFYGRPVNGVQFPWCATFISWCANKAGIPEDVIPKSGGVLTLFEFFMGKKRYYEVGSTIPQQGDLLLNLRKGSTHCGIVVKVDEKGVHTIEGNVDNQVKRVFRRFTDPDISGYARPKYGNNPGIKDNTPVTQFAVERELSVKEAADILGIDGSLLKFMNDLSGDTIPAGTVLIIPEFNKSVAISEEPVALGLTSSRIKQPRSVKVASPTLKVSIYTEDGRLSATNSDGLNTDKADGQIKSVSTTRGLGQDCPTFSAAFSCKDDMYHNISANDLVIIEIHQPPDSIDTVMYGLVDDVRMSTDYSSKSRTVQVTGRGVCKALINFDVGFIDNLSVEFGQGWFANQVNLVGLSSFDAIKLTLDSFLGRTIKYSFGNGHSLSDYAKYAGRVHEGERLIDTAQYASYVGSLWGFIKELGNTPFNETYWEVFEGHPTLVHRPTPFNQKDWESLELHNLRDIDIVSESLGRSDLETYTLYSVRGTMMDEALSLEYLPLWYKPFHAKYGIKHLQLSTIYQTWEGGSVDAAHIKQFFIDLFNFNIKNQLMENGTIVVKGSQKYKIGSRVLIESTGMEYYVESVNHDFSVYQSYTTTLKVTRGLKPGERFTQPWGMYSEFTPADMTELLVQTNTGGWGNTAPFTPLSNQLSGAVSGGGVYSFNTSYQSDGSLSGSALIPPTADYISQSSGFYGGYMNGKLHWPCPTCSDISSPFGKRVPPPISGLGTWHTGIDIPAGMGQPIVAAASGIVEFVRTNNQSTGYGNYIKIKHSDSMSTLYAHCTTVLASVGQRIEVGQKVATIGSTGDSTGAHLHFEVILNGTQVDPLPYFNNRNSQPQSQTNAANTLSGDIEKQCYSVLRKHFNKAAVCGILSNINAESGFKLDALGDGGTSYGLCQWHNERFDTLKYWCSWNNLDHRTVEGQLSYLIHELQTTYYTVWEKLKSVPNTQAGAKQSGEVFCRDFERPANAIAQGKSRGIKAAIQYWLGYIKEA